jgi:hypothetical protein
LEVEEILRCKLVLNPSASFTLKNPTNNVFITYAVKWRHLLSAKFSVYF